MTLKEKIAQLIIVRMSDLIMDASSSYTKMRAPEEAAALAEKYQYGQVAWNCFGNHKAFVKFVPVHIPAFRNIRRDNLSHTCKLCPRVSPTLCVDTSYVRYLCCH